MHIQRRLARISFSLMWIDNTRNAKIIRCDQIEVFKILNDLNVIEGDIVDRTLQLLVYH